jgi:hypothetical protein
VLTKDSATDFDTSWQDAQGGGGGAPDDADYLVGTAHGDLSAEIVVGTSPGGELGGTWAAPTVDATHSGSSHATVQAAAEATAAGALATHAADTTGIHGITDTSALALTANAVMDGDTAGGVLSGTYPNPGFAADMATQAELDAHVNDAADAHDASAISVDSTNLSGTATDVQGSLGELDDLLDDHSSRHENGGADEISVAGLSGELADAQPITVRKNTGADVGTRSRLNFIEGSNVTLTVSDDAGSDEVDITIASSGGGGAGTADYVTAFLFAGA